MGHHRRRPAPSASPSTIGVAQHDLRRYDQARKCYGQALSLAQQVGQASLQAEILLHLADTDQLIGRDSDDRDDRRRALAVLDRLGAPMPRP